MSLMAANDETGTLLPYLEIDSSCCDKAGIVFHTDASQVVGKIPIDLEASSVDLLSFSGHKLYGPKGIGVLILRKRKKLPRLLPLIDGGGHEHGLRSGTLNVPAIVGLGKACEIAAEELPHKISRVEAYRDQFESLLMARLSNIRINGDATHRLPNMSNNAFLGVDPEGLMLASKRWLPVAGSACTAASLEPSHVLRARCTYLTNNRFHGCGLFSFGRQTTLAEVHEAAGRTWPSVP